jgi:hypothetical protein
MSIISAFQNGVNTIFKVMKDAVHNAEYVAVVDNGFDPKSEQVCPVRVILDKFTQHDVKHTSFADLIQTSDVKGLVPGVDVTLKIQAGTGNLLRTDDITYDIVAYDTDPMQIMYVLLLRNSV